MCHLIACLLSFVLPATCHDSCFNLGDLLAWGWLCAALWPSVEQGRGSVYILLANNVSQGIHSSEPGLSWNAQNMLHVLLGHCFTSCIEERQNLWSCLEPHITTCAWSGDKWGVIFHPSHHYHWDVPEPWRNQMVDSSTESMVWKLLMILAGKFL